MAGHKKSVPHSRCRCGKRGFATEREARKALGRAQGKRDRQTGSEGGRRGHNRESRYYECPDSDLYHLTQQSKRQYAGV